MNHFLYKTVRSDGRYYLGMHSSVNINDGYLGSGILITASIKKHGKEAHTREILEMFPSREILEKQEKNLITLEILADPLCMNLVTGGQGGFIHTKETKSKIGNKLRGRKQSLLASERKRISLAGKNKGRYTGLHWFNNGTEHIRCLTCPDGWVPGRLKTDTPEARIKKSKSSKIQFG